MVWSKKPILKATCYWAGSLSEGQFDRKYYITMSCYLGKKFFGFIPRKGKLYAYTPKGKYEEVRP